MQLLGLFSFGLTGPMDSDPYTFDCTAWLSTVTGDTILPTTTMSVTNLDGSSQSSVTVSSFQVQSPLATVWLSGGVPGTTYLVTLGIHTAAGRIDRKSATLVVVSSRS